MSKVKINYVSGHSEIIDVDTFSIKVGSNGREAKWELTDKAKQRPLFINLDAVESVWEQLWL